MYVRPFDVTELVAELARVQAYFTTAGSLGLQLHGSAGASPSR